MQSSTLFSLDSPTSNQITHVYHVSELADIPACLHSLKQVFSLLIQHIESVPGALQSQVATHYSHVVRHYLTHLLHTLCDEHFLLVGHCSLVVPLGHLLVEVIQIHMLQ